MLVYPSETLGSQRVLNSHHLAFWRYVRDKYPFFVPCVAGSAATAQAQHNNGEFNTSMNDVDLWIKETVAHHLTVDDVYELIANFNLWYNDAQLKPTRIVIGYSPFGIDRRPRVGVTQEFNCRMRYLRGYRTLKLGLIVDLEVVNAQDGPVTRSSRAICTPIQLITLFCSLVDPLPFPERVVVGFDLSCVQCWIKSPYRPSKVEFLTRMVEQDIIFKTMCYDLNKYRDDKTTEARVGKYMDRGFRLTRMSVGDTLMFYMDNAALVNINTAAHHSGDASFISQVFNDLRNRHSLILDAIEGSSRMRRENRRTTPRRRSTRLANRRV